MELKSTKRVGINPTHGKKSMLKITFDNLSDFITYLQNNKIQYEERGSISFNRTLDERETLEVKDKVLDLTLETIPQKELELSNYRDYAKQRISELTSEVTVSETERKSLSEIAKTAMLIQNADNIITCKTATKRYFFGNINGEVELLKVDDNYNTDIFTNDVEKIEEFLTDDNNKE